MLNLHFFPFITPPYPFKILSELFVELLQKTILLPAYPSAIPVSNYCFPSITNALPLALYLLPSAANCLPATTKHLPSATFLFPSASFWLASGKSIQRNNKPGHRNDTECLERKMNLFRLIMSLFEWVGVYQQVLSVL